MQSTTDSNACPSCGREIGPERRRCHFCGAGRSPRTSHRTLRLFAIPLVLVAVYSVHLSLNAAPDYRKIASLGEELSFQRVRLLGEVLSVRTLPGKYESDLTITMTLGEPPPPGSTPGPLLVGRGADEIRLKAEGRIARELEQAGAAPVPGDLVEVWATLYAGPGYRVLSLGDPHLLRVVGETRTSRRVAEVALAELMASPERHAGRTLRIPAARLAAREGKFKVRIRDPQGPAELGVFGVGDRVAQVGDLIAIRGTFSFREASQAWELQTLRGDLQAVEVLSPGNESPGHVEATVDGLLSDPEPLRDRPVRLKDVEIVKRINEYCLAVRDPGGQEELLLFGVTDVRWSSGDRVSVRGTFFFYEHEPKRPERPTGSGRSEPATGTAGAPISTGTGAATGSPGTPSLRSWGVVGAAGRRSSGEPGEARSGERADLLESGPTAPSPASPGEPGSLASTATATASPPAPASVLSTAPGPVTSAAPDAAPAGYWEIKAAFGDRRAVVPVPGAGSPGTANVLDAGERGSVGERDQSRSGERADLLESGPTAPSPASPGKPGSPSHPSSLDEPGAGGPASGSSAGRDDGPGGRRQPERAAARHRPGASAVEPGVAAAAVGAALLGALVAAIFSLIPGLHIFNVIAITMLITFQAMSLFESLDPLVLTGFLLGMVVAFSMLFTVSSQYFQPSDESFRSIVLPHERLLFDGRAHEAVMLGGIGGLTALFFMAMLLPVIPGLVSAVVQFLQPHHYWIVATICTHLLITEWPKDHGAGKTAWQRLQDGWVQLMMGYFTFFAAGALGILVFHRTMVPLDAAFQSLMPLFVGLFALPSHVMTFLTGTTVPPQHASTSVELQARDVVKGGFSGLLAGCFASLTPGLTPGPALLLSGHVTSQSGERQFIIGGGAARVMYYAGAMLLLFLPGVFLRRGGAAINISLIFVPEAPEQFYLVNGIIALVGAVAFLALGPYSALCASLSRRVPFQAFSAAGMAILVLLVGWITGSQGLLLMTVATFLGLVPNMWHTRRISLLAVLLVPMFLNMSGLGPAVARFLGLH